MERNLKLNFACSCQHWMEHYQHCHQRALPSPAHDRENDIDVSRLSLFIKKTTCTFPFVVLQKNSSVQRAYSGATIAKYISS